MWSHLAEKGTNIVLLMEVVVEEHATFSEYLRRTPPASGPDPFPVDPGQPQVGVDLAICAIVETGFRQNAIKYVAELTVAISTLEQCLIASPMSQEGASRVLVEDREPLRIHAEMRVLGREYLASLSRAAIKTRNTLHKIDWTRRRISQFTTSLQLENPLSGLKDAADLRVVETIDRCDLTQHLRQIVRRNLTAHCVQCRRTGGPACQMVRSETHRRIDLRALDAVLDLPLSSSDHPVGH